MRRKSVVKNLRSIMKPEKIPLLSKGQYKMKKGHSFRIRKTKIMSNSIVRSPATYGKKRDKLAMYYNREFNSKVD